MTTKKKKSQGMKLFLMILVKLESSDVKQILLNCK